MVEADTVAHCGPTLIGEFCRTLTMTDMATGWTECASIRNNAHKWIVQAIGDLRSFFPFPITGFDSDNGSEFINHDLVQWMHNRDIAFTRSRPYKKNDGATVEAKNNTIVRRHAFYWRYDTAEELALLNQLWRAVSLRTNYFTATRKPIDWKQTIGSRRRRVYDAPKTPWQRVIDAGITSPADAANRIAGINPADLTRQITAIQAQPAKLAQTKTEQLSQSRRLDMTRLTPSINRLTTQNPQAPRDQNT